MEKKTYKVVCAAIIRTVDNMKEVLATQRGYGNYAGSWEFPGGKIEPGETPEQALEREIREELSADIKVDGFFLSVTHEYPEFHLNMDCYLCSLTSGDFTLEEHMDARWLSAATVDSVDWLAADQPIVAKLKDTLF